MKLFRDGMKPVYKHEKSNVWERIKGPIINE